MCLREDCRDREMTPSTGFVWPWWVERPLLTLAYSLVALGVLAFCAASC